MDDSTKKSLRAMTEVLIGHKKIIQAMDKRMAEIESQLLMIGAYLNMQDEKSNKKKEYKQ